MKLFLLIILKVGLCEQIEEGCTHECHVPYLGSVSIRLALLRIVRARSSNTNSRYFSLYMTDAGA